MNVRGGESTTHSSARIRRRGPPRLFRLLHTRQFLEGRELEMRDDVDVALYEAAIPSPGGSGQAHEAMPCKHPGLVLQLQSVPVYTCTKRQPVAISGKLSGSQTR
jgi:hypothetical protein